MGFFGTKAHNLWIKFNDNFDRIAKGVYIIILFFGPFLTAWHVYNYPDNIAGTIALSLIISTCGYIAKALSEFYAPKQGMPSNPRRFTHRSDDMVYIDNNDYYTAISYLADIEDWMQDMGMTR